MEKINIARLRKERKMNYTQDSFFKTQDSTSSEEEEKCSTGYTTRRSTNYTPTKPNNTFKLLGSMYTSRIETTLITKVDEKESQRMYETQVFDRADKSTKRAREASARATSICIKMN